VQEYRKLVDMLGFQVLALFDLFFIKEVSSWSKSSRRVIFVKSSREGKRQGLGPKKKLIPNETGFEVSCTLLLVHPKRSTSKKLLVKRKKESQTHITISLPSLKSSNFYLKTPRSLEVLGRESSRLTFFFESERNRQRAA
jgi:hypothetical protein